MHHANEAQDVVPRCPACFAPGTLVRTETGYRPIETIEVGDRVLSSDGTYQKVTEVMSRPFSGMAYLWRTTAMAQPVISTGEHPIWALRSDHRHNNKTYMVNGVPHCGPSVCEPYHATQKGLRGKSHEMAWTHAHQLGEKSWVGTRVPLNETDLDEIVVPRRYAHNKGVGVRRKGPQSFPVTDDFLWMVGMYLAEGSAGKRSINFALHEDEVEYRERLVRIFTEYGYSTRIHDTNPGRGISVHVNSSVLSEWFSDWLGRGCDNKHIPEKLMALPPKKAMEIVGGIWCGDGFKNGYNRIGQTSRVMALQISEILQRAGEQPLIAVQVSRTPAPSGAARKPCYINSWAADHSNKKQIKGRWNFKGEDQLAQIVHFRPVSYDGLVYNLEVEGTHTYVVQNTLVHNCYDDVYKQGERYDCNRCYGTTFDGGVAQAFRAWGLFTDANDAETFGKRGLWHPIASSVQTEHRPDLWQRDYVVRVAKWSSDHRVEEIDGIYVFKQVVNESLRTGGMHGQTIYDTISQRADLQMIADNMPITLYPVKGVQFDRFDGKPR